MPLVFTNLDNCPKPQNYGLPGDAGDWTRGLSHAKRTLYRWATSPGGGIKPCGPIYHWAIVSFTNPENNRGLKRQKFLEMPGIEPGAFHMQSERSTTELHPLSFFKKALWPGLPLNYISWRTETVLWPGQVGFKVTVTSVHTLTRVLTLS